MYYDQDVMNRYADVLESYLERVERFLIYEGLSSYEYEETIKMVRKLIKKCRKGKGDDIFDPDRYEEARQKRLL